MVTPPNDPAPNPDTMLPPVTFGDVAVLFSPTVEGIGVYYGLIPDPGPRPTDPPGTTYGFVRHYVQERSYRGAGVWRDVAVARDSAGDAQAAKAQLETERRYSEFRVIERTVIDRVV